MSASREAVTREAPDTAGGLDVEAVREAFPALHQTVHDRPLAYLDNAATSHACRAATEAADEFDRRDRSNVHRGIHVLSERATAAYEGARDEVRRFLNAPSRTEVVFTRGTTEAINLVAGSWGDANVGEGDAVVVTEMEHHSDIVPWQLLCERTGAELLVTGVTDEGELRLDDLAEHLDGGRVRLVCCTHVSNALGTVNPVEQVVDMAHERGVPVLIDGAQAVPHVPVDLREIACDFYAFSGHKVYGPTGIGVLWAREEILEAMPPWQGGGEMIKAVSFEETLWNDIPYKFEAGTPPIGPAIALGAALEWFGSLDAGAVRAHEDRLLARATEELRDVEGVRILGTAPEKVSVLSLVIDGVHPHDVGTILDREGVAIRSGHHCSQPLMTRYGIPGTARASFAVYNTDDEVDALVRGVRKVGEVFSA